MKDLYAMNKETGEIEPCTKVIHEFYKTHDCLERWTDYWEVTEIEVEEIELLSPDFTKVLLF